MNSDYNASRHADRHQNVGSFSSQHEETVTTTRQEEERRTSPLLSSEIPNSDLSVDFSTIIGSTTAEETEKIEKRRSNLLKLNEENEKLQRELQAMSERLKAAEQKRAQLQAGEQKRSE